MSKRRISADIDLTLIDKTRIREKNGHKYYDIMITVKDEKDQFGQDCSIEQGQTKEEREVKSKVVYLGNGKTVWTGEDKPKEQYASSVEDKKTINDLPF